MLRQRGKQGWGDKKWIVLFKNRQKMFVFKQEGY